MKRIVLVAALALFAFPSFAATTWSVIARTAPDYRGSKSVKATCTTGSESAPSGTGTATAPVGVELTEVGSYMVVVKAPEAGQTVASGKLLAYYYDAVDAIWVRIPDLDLTISSTAARGYTFLGSSPGLGQPVISRRPGSRIAYLPDGVTAANGLIVSILAAGTRGEDL